MKERQHINFNGKMASLTCHWNSHDDESVCILDIKFRKSLDEGHNLGIRHMVLDNT